MRISIGEIKTNPHTNFSFILVVATFINNNILASQGGVISGPQSGWIILGADPCVLHGMSHIHVHSVITSIMVRFSLLRALGDCLIRNDILTVQSTDPGHPQE